MGTSRQTNTVDPSGGKVEAPVLPDSCNLKATKAADGTWTIPLLDPVCLEKLLGKGPNDAFGSTDFFNGENDFKAVVAYYDTLDPNANPEIVYQWFSDILANSNHGEQKISWFHTKGWVPTGTTGVGQTGPDSSGLLDTLGHAFTFLTTASNWLLIGAAFGGILLLVIGGKKAMDGGQ